MECRGWPAAPRGSLESERRAEHLDTPVRHMVSLLFGNVGLASNPLLPPFCPERGRVSRSRVQIALGNKKVWGSAGDHRASEKTGDASSAPSKRVNPLSHVRLERVVKSDPCLFGLVLVVVMAHSQRIARRIVPFSPSPIRFRRRPQAVESNFFGKLISSVPLFRDLPALRPTPLVPDGR